MRYSPTGRGKSGGAQVLYVGFEVYEIVYFITLYPKTEKEAIA